MPSPTVTVVIPTYNRCELLNRALQSVFAQDFSDFEVIVVDDASTDGTESFCTSLKDSRFRYIRLEQNSGAQYARNRGLHAASGWVFCFLDSDDYFLPRSLSMRVAYYRRNPECESSYSDFEICFCGQKRDFVKRVSVGFIPPEQLYDSMMTTLLLAPTTVFMAKRETFLDVGGMDESLPASHDDDIFLRFAKRGTCHYIPGYVYRMMNDATGSITRNTKRLSMSRTMLINKYKDDVISIKGKGALQRLYIRNAINLFFSGAVNESRTVVSVVREYGSIPWGYSVVLLIRWLMFYFGRRVRDILFKFYLS